MKRSATESKQADNQQGAKKEAKEVEFNYAATIKGKLFDTLPLPSEVLEELNSNKTPDLKFGERICDSAESVIDMANQFGFSLTDIKQEIVDAGIVFKYLNQLENGGFSQWVYTFRPSSDAPMVDAIRTGLKNIKANLNLEAFNDAMQILSDLPAEELELFQESDYDLDDGPEEVIRGKLDANKDKMLALAKDPEDGGKSDKECLRILLNKFAIDITKTNIVFEVTDEAVTNTDPLQFLTPTWWPSSIPECKITNKEDSAQLLAGLRRAASYNGFGFVRVGNVTPTSPSMPDVPSADEIFKIEEEDKDDQEEEAPPTPTASTSTFWIVSTTGPMLCQIFDAPSGTDEDAEYIPQMAVFFTPDGTPCGMGPLGDDLEDGGDEGDQNLFDIQEGEEEGDAYGGEGDDVGDDEDAPDLVPM